MSKKDKNDGRAGGESILFLLFLAVRFEVYLSDIYICIYKYDVYILHPIYYLFTCILSLLVVTQIRGHTAGSSPPPTAVRAFNFYREGRFQLFLASSTCVELSAHARQAFSATVGPFFFKISPRWDSNSQINSININGSIRGLYTTVNRPPGRCWVRSICMHTWSATAVRTID